jgi:hypothetical protein
VSWKIVVYPYYHSDSKMSELKIGVVVEIKTVKGYAYAQYTHHHKQYGALLRVFDVCHAVRPVSFIEIIQGKPIFMCFFPLRAAVKRNIVSVVDNLTVPPDAKTFPIFRCGVVDPATRKVGVWWLWDGEKEWRVGDLSMEQRALSIRGVWNDTLLIERIESGWRPETDIF